MRNRYSSSVMVIVDNWKFINDHVHIRCTWTNSLFFCMYVHMDQLLTWKFDQERALSTADMIIVLLRNFLLWIAARPWLQTRHGNPCIGEHHLPKRFSELWWWSCPPPSIRLRRLDAAIGLRYMIVADHWISFPWCWGLGFRGLGLELGFVNSKRVSIWKWVQVLGFDIPIL